MKKILLLAGLAVFASTSYATTDHYMLKDGGYVRHVKVTQIKDDYTVSADVDYQATGTDNQEHCSVNVSSTAKSVAPNELVLKKHSESAASFCELKIHVSPTGVKVEELNDCSDFTVGKCHFSSDGKELLKIK